MKVIIVLVLVLIFFGCMKPYYGYSEIEWSNLSEDEKKAAKAEYQQVIEAGNSQHREDIINARRQSIIDQGVGAQ